MKLIIHICAVFLLLTLSWTEAKVRILSVGKSGVGKSTIGNVLLEGKWQGVFDTSPSSISCTQSVKCREASDISFCDVPGIPDTNPRNTKKFYDMIIEEAKKELTAILFVFKYERIDHDLYKLSKMLFREIKKSKAIKILVINNMNYYNEKRGVTPPTGRAYEELQKQIAIGTGMTFDNIMVVTSDTMEQELDALKSLLKGAPMHRSPELKTFVELGNYVDDLQRNKNYHQEVYDDAVARKKTRIADIEGEIKRVNDAIIGYSVGSGVSGVLAFFTLGITGAASARLAAEAISASETKRKLERRLEEAERYYISRESLDKAEKVLREAVYSFQELRRALESGLEP